MTILAFLLVASGLIGLGLALKPIFQICKLTQFGHKGWLVLYALVWLFIAGYLSYLNLLFERQISQLEFIVALIFGGGAGFVLLVSHMSKLTINSLQQALEEKQHQANHDPLTGLPNRQNFYHQMDRFITSQSPFFCLMLDLDDFKMINDTFGHHCGDEILKVIASRMLNCATEQVFTARLGGDEFVILVPGVEVESARLLAQSIQSALQQDIAVESHALSIGVSIGIARFPDDSTDKKNRLKLADIAMYQAKNNNLHCQFYSDAMLTS